MTTSNKQSAATDKRGLAYDPAAAVRYLAAADATLARLMELTRPFAPQVRHMHNPFEALARNIVYQQLHATAAEAIHRRVVALFGKRKLAPEDVLNAPEADLRGAGLSGAKTAALKDLAAKTLDGTVPTLARLRRMDDEEIIARLITVRGIGRWTVEMLLMSRLGRGDVLPVGDLGVRRGFAITYQLPENPTPRALAEYGERWRPYRSVASWYMWRVPELPPGMLPLKRRRAQKSGR
jgi:DNA-3-methyladenine glycosylase II